VDLSLENYGEELVLGLAALACWVPAAGAMAGPTLLKCEWEPINARP